MKRLIIFDVDGTLANTDWRKHLWQQEPRDWTKIREQATLDPVHDEIKYLNNVLYFQPDNIVVIVTARSEEDRECTEIWLNNHGIQYHNIKFRSKGDKREDYLVKEEILYQLINEYKVKPYLVFEDRPSVIEMWRKHGIKTLAVEEGDV